MTIVILGGGISGLYIGVELLKKGYSDIKIIERSDNVGGRVYSKRYHNITYESGAGRFSNDHLLLLNLINRYKLENDIIPINHYSLFINTEKNKTKNVFSSDINDYYKIIKYHFDKKSKKDLISMTGFDFLKKIFGIEKLNHFLILYSYQEEIQMGSAYASIKLIIDDYLTKNYYSLKNGLQKIIYNLENEFKERGGIIETKLSPYKITTNKDNSYTLYFSEKTIHCSKVILTIPPNEIEHYGFYFSWFKYIHKIPLLRIYFLYNKPYSKLINLPKYTTYEPIHYVIPINSQCIMIHYSDGDLAKEWYKLHITNKTECMNRLIEQFKKVSNISLKKPDLVSFEYWMAGVHIWKPNFSFDQPKIRSKIINPRQNLYICNEAISMKQTWIESSLITAHEVLDYF